MRRVLLALCVSVLCVTGCSDRPGRTVHRPGPSFLWPPGEWRQGPAGPRMALGAYFLEARTLEAQVHVVAWHDVRVFARRGVAPVPSVDGIPVRWVIAHAYGGYNDIEEARAWVRQAAEAGVRYFELGNELDACQYSAWEFARALLRYIREMVAQAVVWSNMERFWDCIGEWEDDARELAMGADFVAVHALEPHDVERIPGFLWGSGRLEISTDGQGCADRGCRHTNTAELYTAIVRRLCREPATVGLEVDFVGPDGAVRNDWTGPEWKEFIETHLNLPFGCVQVP